MTSTETAEQQAEIRVLDQVEIDCVAGGFRFEMGGLPDRAVAGSGTMWLLTDPGKILTGAQQ